MKKSSKILIGLIAMILILAIVFMIMSQQLVNQAKSTKVSEIEFANISDGNYQGEFTISPVSVKVESHIKDGRLEKITILEHFNGLGQAAEQITDKMIEEQALGVEVISGATVSSICIQKAVEDSLLQK